MKSLKTQPRIGRFFKRHSRVIASVGTVIIFATFIVKDAVREHVKELADSLASAKSQYENQTADLVVKNTVEDIESDIFSIMGHFGIKGLRSSTSSWDFDFGMSTLRLDRWTLEQSMALITKLPNHKDLEDQGNKLLAKISQLDIEGNAVRRDPNSDKPQGLSPGEITVTDKNFNKVVGSKNAWIYRTGAAHTDVTKFAKSVFDKAEGVKKWDEMVYKICTRISWFLYTLGTVISFVAGIYSDTEAHSLG